MKEENILRKQIIPFTQIPNEIINHKTITIQALGLYCFMQSKPIGWKFTAKLLAFQINNINEKTVKKYIKELKDLGYLTYKKFADGTGEYLLTITVQKPKGNNYPLEPKRQILPPISNTINTNNDNTLFKIDSLNEKKESNTILAVKPKSLHSRLKKIFFDFYTHKTEQEYYWTVKDAAGMKQLILKLKFSLQKENKKSSAEKIKVTDTDIEESFKIFLLKIKDNWVLQNLSVYLLNSKYNELLNKIKNGQASSNQQGRNVTEEDIRRVIQSKKH